LRQRPLFEQFGSEVDRSFVAGLHRVEQRAGQSEAHFLDARPWAGHDDDEHARRLGAVARDADLGLEVALGLGDRAHLRRRSTDQAVELQARHVAGGARIAKARQVQVLGEQAAQRLGGAYLERVGVGQGRLRRALRRRRQLARPGRRRAPRKGGQPRLEARASAQTRCGGGQCHRCRESARCAHRAHLLSSRIAPSSPASVSGNMRWFINCCTTAMLCR
jgi:hypothetical protein